MQAYRVSGEYEHGALKHWSRFHYEFVVPTEQEARERALSILGSKHRVKRRFVVIEEVAPVTAADATDPLVRALLEKGQAA
jgi:large subunit ribosomal protein LX